MTTSDLFLVVENVKDLLSFVAKFCCAAVTKLSTSRPNDVSGANIQNVITSLSQVQSRLDECNSDLALTKTLKDRIVCSTINQSSWD